MGEHELLFSTADLGGTLDKLAARAKATIMQLDAAQLDAGNEDALLERLTHDFVVNTLQIHRDKMTMKGPREVPIELRGDQAFSYGEDHVTVRGIEVTFIIPFDGDAWLFKCRPNTWTSVFPEGEITGQEYRLTLCDPEKNADRLTKNRDRQLRHVDEYIRWQGDQIQAFNEAIVRQFHECSAQRRQELQANQELTEAFDVPQHVAKETPTQAAPVPRRRKMPIPESVKEAAHADAAPTGHGRQATQLAIDVFICHASEDKDAFVRPLADALRAEGVSVWYDEYSLSIGDRLRRSIDKGLGAARYGVVVLSPAFFKKDWPQTELDGLVEKEIGSEKVILPIWHDVSREDVVRYSPTLADRGVNAIPS